MSRYFLGTNFGHNASAAVVGPDGEIVGAVEEGRLVGEKGTDRFPEDAISWLLEEVGNKGRGLLWAEGWSPRKRLLLKGLLPASRYGLAEPFYRKRALREMQRFHLWRQRRREWYPRLGRPHICGHHLAHAFSLLPAGLRDGCLVIVSDTTSEWAAISIYLWSKSRFVKLEQSSFPHSLGNAYHRMSHHLGFFGRTGPGKMMALAGLGSPVFLQDFRETLDLRKGRLGFDLRRFPAWRREDAWLRFGERQPNPRLEEALDLCRFGQSLGKDVAASVQAFFTETTWALVRWGVDHARQKLGIPVRQIGLAGGCALNCKANGLFKERLRAEGIDEMVVSPWSDDSGTALGAAVWAAWKYAGIRTFEDCGPFLGPPASAAPAAAVDEDSYRSAAKALARGELVALVSGRLEFGPRALGGRCLLGDPRQPEIRARINERKGRPDFMPVAPAVLASVADQYFRGTPSEHMAWTVDARASSQPSIPSAVHVDGSSRVQVINEERAPALAALVKEFGRISGVPLVLLTSLNGSGEAIPASLTQARAIATRLDATGVLSDEGWLPIETAQGDTSTPTTRYSKLESPGKRSSSLACSN